MAFKEQVKELNKTDVIYKGGTSTIYRLDDGRLYKELTQETREACLLSGLDYEKKVMNTSAKSVSEILSPISVTYEGKICTGFTMEEIVGPTLNSYDEDYTLLQRANFKELFEIYWKIERVVKKANKVGIVMPDLCTCDNIILLPDGTIKFIDFDGMQFGKTDKALSVSSSLENAVYYLKSKKFSDSYFHFTSELDKTSLTILLFLVVFNVNLNNVGKISPYTNRMITLKEIFDILGLQDDKFMSKVEANLSLDKKGAYLADDLRRIVQNYEMAIAELPEHLQQNGRFVKRLFRK